MTKLFSIALAKGRLHRIVREVEAGGTVAFTRRGKPVVILMSKAEYDRIQSRKRRIDWGAGEIDTHGFKFDREEVNAR
jgi:prevent-host-death family protein